jgi:Cu/Ag efflux protein CusF
MAEKQEKNKIVEKPEAAVAEAVQVTATIKDIDYDTREVTLLGEDGSTTTLQIGPEARNLNQAKKGDKVKITYLEALMLDV